MPDIFSKRKRSLVMSRIKSRNTNLEVNFLRILSARLYPKGFRYRKHYNKVLGRPDIVFVREKIAVFLDGDFWHGFDLKRGKMPPRKYWLPKIRKNVERDKKVNATLRKIGWKVLRFWEHEIKKNPQAAIKSIEFSIEESRSFHQSHRSSD